VPAASRRELRPTGPGGRGGRGDAARCHRGDGRPRLGPPLRLLAPSLNL